VHGRNQHHALLDPAFPDHGFHLRRDVDVLTVLASVKGEVFGVGFHGVSMPVKEVLKGKNGVTVAAI
jgi:hypothetical protein